MTHKEKSWEMNLRRNVRNCKDKYGSFYFGIFYQTPAVNMNKQRVLSLFDVCWCQLDHHMYKPDLKSAESAFSSRIISSLLACVKEQVLFGVVSIIAQNLLAGYHLAAT